ncbi:MAG: hypothetical protein AAF267_24970 [Deinococcota bacterium]
MIRIGGPISDSPFYGTDFPDGYFDEGPGATASQQSFLRRREIQAAHQGESMCDLGKINIETIEFQVIIDSEAGIVNDLADFVLRYQNFVASAALTVYDSSQGCFESVDGVPVPIHTPLVADCRQPHADFASDFNLFRESVDAKLRGNHLRNAHRNVRAVREAQEQELVEALSQPGCKDIGITNTETLTIPVNYLGSSSWETVRGENRSFIRNDGVEGNDGDVVGYFTVSSSEEFLQITSYINHELGEDGLMGLPNPRLLRLPAETVGGVQIEATCPVDEGLPEPNYTGIVLAAAPGVGTNALYVTVECNFPN